MHVHVYVDIYQTASFIRPMDIQRHIPYIPFHICTDDWGCTI